MLLLLKRDYSNHQKNFIPVSLFTNVFFSLLIIIKSLDYNLDSINALEKTALSKVNTKIEFVDLLIGKSTTDLISRIKSL